MRISSQRPSELSEVGDVARSRDGALIDVFCVVAWHWRSVAVTNAGRDKGKKPREEAKEADFLQTCHSGELRNPENSTKRTLAFAGATNASEFPCVKG